MTFINKFCIVYFDILIFSPNLLERLQHSRLVLSSLKNNKLYLNLSKCEFVAISINFLGYVRNSHGSAED